MIQSKLTRKLIVTLLVLTLLIQAPVGVFAEQFNPPDPMVAQEVYEEIEINVEESNEQDGTFDESETLDETTSNEESEDISETEELEANPLLVLGATEDSILEVAPLSSSSMPDFSMFPLVTLPPAGLVGTDLPTGTQWRLNPDNNTAELSNVPNQPAWTALNHNVILPETITHEGNTYTLISIGVNAFQGSHQVRQISMADSITHIGSSAFLNMGGMGVNQSLQHVNHFSSNLIYIGDRAFEGVPLRTMAPLPEGLLHIGDQAFLDVGFGAGSTPTNTNLHVNLPNSLEHIGEGAFQLSLFHGSIVIPSNITSISPRAFSMMYWVTDIQLHDDITHIGANAFQGVAANMPGGLIGNRFPITTPLVWPANLEYIGNEAFQNAIIANVTPFPEGLRHIGNQAFQGFGPSFNYALAGVSNVVNIPLVFPDSLEHIGVAAFQSSSFPLPADNTLRIPPLVTEISEHAFNMMPHINGGIIYLESHVTSIGLGAFRRSVAQRNAYNGWVEVTLHEGLEYIGAWAFENNSTLTHELVIPRSVTTFGYEMRNSDNRHLGRSWLFTNFSAITHPRFVRPMEGSLPVVSNRQVPVPDVSGWEDTYRISTSNPLLYKSARWTNDNLTEAEILFHYGTSVSYNLEFDVVFVLDYSGSMLDIVDAHYDGVDYRVPPILVLNDLLGDAIDILLEGNNNGYDNRIAITAFSDDEVWRTGDFSADGDHLRGQIRSNPNLVGGNANFQAGLQAAIEMIEEREDDSRQPVVIFIGGGEPWPQGPALEYRRGLEEAAWLRDNGIPVFPLGIYLTDMAELDAIEALTAISFDEETFYFADSTEEFVEALGEVVQDIVTVLPPTAITDTLSDYFEFRTGTDVDLIPSAGTVTIDSATNTFTWDLTGQESGIAHTLTARIRLQDQYHTSPTGTGSLPTNSQTTATGQGSDINTTNSPRLVRYIVTHEFVNCIAGESLPPEVAALTPVNRGGYRHNTTVVSTGVTQTIITIDDARWGFVGWDHNAQTINNVNVHFIGEWCYIPEGAVTDFEFTKVSEDLETPLAGAVFHLYTWDESNEAWLTSAIQVETSAGNGLVRFQGFSLGSRYRLVEVSAPDGYITPTGYWILHVLPNGTIIILANDDEQPEFINDNAYLPNETAPENGGGGNNNNDQHNNQTPPNGGAGNNNQNNNQNENNANRLPQTGAAIFSSLLGGGVLVVTGLVAAKKKEKQD